MSKGFIHPTAVVNSSAVVGHNVQIGPYTVLEKDTVVGDGCRIGAHVVIKKYTVLGRDNLVFEGAVLGGEPQDVKFAGQRSYLHIGNQNIFRENVTVNRATEPEGKTTIKNGCFLMAYSHVAHECVLGNKVVLANNVALAGHVSLGNQAFLSGGAGVHQFCRVGEMSMVGGQTKVVQDVLHFFLVDGFPAVHRSLNLVGLRRNRFSKEEVQLLKASYRLLASKELKLAEKLRELKKLDSKLPALLVDFIRSSERGICNFSS